MTKKLSAEQVAKNKAAGKRAGRPSFVPTPENRALVLHLSGLGVPQETIASFIRNGDKVGIGITTLVEHFANELEQGRSHANLKVAGALFKLATSGTCIAATIFWLKTRAHWRESAQQHELSGPNGTPLIPAPEGAVPLEDYKKAMRDVLKEH